jgi:hypothetical protein
MLSKIKAASQAPKKPLKLSTLVSSLLQVYPSPIFNCGIRVKDKFVALNRVRTIVCLVGAYLMKHVKSLNLGFGDAENYRMKEYKELFNHIFVKNEFLEKLLAPSTFFLIGEKGTGKTALLSIHEQ